MRSQIAFACFVIFLAQHVVSELLPSAAEKKEKAEAFSFANVSYLHRFTKDDQHEYTPDGQEDLNAWTDIVTINLYRKAKNGDALAATANAVLENYKANRGLVLLRPIRSPGPGTGPRSI